MSLVKPDLSEITILREKNTHLEHVDDTHWILQTDTIDISWKVANTSNCILIHNVGSQKRYNMDFLQGVDIFKIFKIESVKFSATISALLLVKRLVL